MYLEVQDYFFRRRIAVSYILYGGISRNTYMPADKDSGVMKGALDMVKLCRGLSLDAKLYFGVRV